MHPANRLEYRGDIEGMRAIAVLLVVIGHASIGWFSGGYAGVDVFFVISGFLITSLLTKELSSTGKISIRQFYARRALRLLPASTVVLLATLVASWSWLSPLRFADTVQDIVASAFYFINFRLAEIGTDYLASDDPPSPVQHFWSLAVEEQFYVFWPVLILLATLWSRRRGHVRFGPLAVILGTLTVGSLALSWLVTHQNAPWAYFGTHTRAWELGLGALVALGAPKLVRLPRVAAELAAWVGLGAIITSALMYDEFTAFPGIAALLPVGGAALLIAAGCRSSSAGRVLSIPPLRVLGKLSYGWYLWHWPLLIVVPAAFDLSPSPVVNLVLVGIALVLAQISLVAVENPIRHLATLRRRPGRGIGLGLSLSSSTAAVALGMAILLPPGGMPGLLTADAPRFMPPEAMGGLPTIISLPEPGAGPAAKPMPSMVSLIEQGLKTQNLPSNLDPPIAKAAKDMPILYSNGCHLGLNSSSLPNGCFFGDLPSPTTVVLFGDSHAAQWFPTLLVLAAQQEWRLVSLTKSSCGPADVAVFEKGLNRVYTECQQWRAKALARIAELRPALVLVSALFDSRNPVPATSDPGAAWVEGWKRSFVSLQGSAEHVAMMVDTPYRSTNGPDCAAGNPTRLTACIQSTSGALWEPVRRANVAKLAESLGVVVIDPIPWMCLNSKCPIVIRNVLVYRDNHHISQPFARLVAPMLEASLPSLAP
ncbi:acyltransferase family protein [Catelliglobosispora koreensis]|uniref:acyltransferase family protein n=1 Tax=Catelliglobosispora koreensis TaxID=129052 RepID=UPI00036809A5|nr:acyltransferase family protein [Catelliglobosispora koreensis]